MSSFDETLADYDSMQLTTGRHLIEHVRDALDEQDVVSALGLTKERDGKRVRTAGAVIVRQRPGTAKGFVFLTLEDETGMSQAIIHPDLFKEYRTLIVTASALVVEGVLQNKVGQPSIRAERLWPVDVSGVILSHDFH